MHQLVLITAMTATTGLFGGGKHCGKPKHHGHQAVAVSCPSPAPCGGSYAAPVGTPYAPSAPSAQGYPTSPQSYPTAPMAPGKMAPGAPMAPPQPR